MRYMCIVWMWLLVRLVQNGCLIKSTVPPIPWWSFWPSSSTGWGSCLGWTHRCPRSARCHSCTCWSRNNTATGVVCSVCPWFPAPVDVIKVNKSGSELRKELGLRKWNLARGPRMNTRFCSCCAVAFDFRCCVGWELPWVFARRKAPGCSRCGRTQTCSPESHSWKED